MREAQDMQQAAEEGGELGEAEAEQMMQNLDDKLPAFLNLAWAVNKRDISSTLKVTCQKLFDDASVPKELRLARARAVAVLGREFRAVAAAHSVTASNHFEASDIKARMAVATMTTMAKAQGQDVTEEDQQAMIQKAKMEMASGIATTEKPPAAASDK